RHRRAQNYSASVYHRGCGIFGLISDTGAPVVLAALVAFAAGLGGLALVAPGPAALPEQRVAGRPVQVPSDGYASSSSCRACHPGQYASWHGSYHRTMTQVATPETVAASFDGVIVDNVPGSPMLLEQRGRRLSAVFDDPDDEVKGLAPESDSARPRRIDRQVVMTTGSHNQQIYWYATGNSRVVRHLVRGVPWAGRAAPPRQPQPAAPVRPPRHRPRRFHGRAADAPESASVVAGLRAVPLLLGVLQSAERAASQRARAALPARGRARRDAFHRAT